MVAIRGHPRRIPFPAQSPAQGTPALVNLSRVWMIHGTSGHMWVATSPSTRMSLNRTLRVWVVLALVLLRLLGRQRQQWLLPDVPRVLAAQAHSARTSVIEGVAGCIATLALLPPRVSTGTAPPPAFSLGNRTPCSLSGRVPATGGQLRLWPVRRGPRPGATRGPALRSSVFTECCTRLHPTRPAAQDRHRWGDGGGDTTHVRNGCDTLSTTGLFPQTNLRDSRSDSLPLAPDEGQMPQKPNSSGQRG